MLLGIHLTLLIGPTVPVPAPPLLTEALQSARVEFSDDGQSGFQITFQTGRGGPLGTLDYPLVCNPLLNVFNRVVLVVTFNALPRVLMDGIITDQQFTPSNEPGQSTMTITGEAPAATYSFAGGTVSAFTSALNTALAALTPAGSATFSGGSLSLNCGSGGGLVVQQDPAQPADRGGRGFSAFFGLNDLVSRPTPIIFESGVDGADLHGFASGGAITYRVTDSAGRFVAEKTITISGPPARRIRRSISPPTLFRWSRTSFDASEIASRGLIEPLVQTSTVSLS